MRKYIMGLVAAMAMVGTIGFAAPADAQAAKQVVANPGSRVYVPATVRGKAGIKQLGFVERVVTKDGKQYYVVKHGKNKWYALWKRSRSEVAVERTTAIIKKSGMYNVHVRA